MLDLGCGTGRTTIHIKNLGNHVIGSDISPLMITRAKKLHPNLDFEVQDACVLPYTEDVFDAVVFSFNGLDCIYPEENRVKALKEIFMVLKPGGVFVFSSHNRGTRTNRNWRRRPRKYKGFYMKEKTVYGDLILYYGFLSRTLNTLDSLGFKNTKHYKTEGKSWRYYVTWASF